MNIVGLFDKSTLTINFTSNDFIREQRNTRIIKKGENIYVNLFNLQNPSLTEFDEEDECVGVIYNVNLNKLPKKFEIYLNDEEAGTVQNITIVEINTDVKE